MLTVSHPVVFIGNHEWVKCLKLQLAYGCFIKRIRNGPLRDSQQASVMS